MNGLCALILCISALGAAEARMPTDLRNILMGESDDDLGTTGLKDEVKKVPETFFGSNFDELLSPSIRTAMKNFRAGTVDQYMPAPIKTVQCHVEFQVTERLPGRCTKLAGSIPACQAEKYLGINYSECS